MTGATWKLHLVVAPYVPMAWSKNRVHTRGRKLSRAARAARDALAVQVATQIASEGLKPTQAKLRLSVMVYRPSMQPDPQNVLDLLCDAVQLGTGVDDRWYSGSWDWEVDRENPRLEIVLSQGGE